MFPFVFFLLSHVLIKFKIETLFKLSPITDDQVDAAEPRDKEGVY